MNAGPTTEGSIVGYLRLNDSDWNETLDRAEARARRLATVDPTITVDANTATAMSKIEAVEAAKTRLGLTDASVGVNGSPAKIDGVAAAQKRLEAAERAAANAASSQYLAELRLEDVQGRRSKSAYSLAAAEEAVARATRNAEAAEMRHLVATDALTQAQQASARAALAEAGAQETDAAATNKANAAKGLAVSRTGLLITAAAALIPLIAPLAGFAVGAAGALAGMGAAGILAIVGIKQAMDQGNAVGAQYSAGLKDLKGGLDQLASTAATEMLSYFRTSVTAITQALPMLNGQVQVFSALLGGAGVAALKGVISGLYVANPLFVTASKYVDDLARGFQRWATDGGLQQFISYAVAEFPTVVSAVGSLADAAVHLITAFAPIGTVVLQGITAVSNVISAIPVPVLTEVAAGALAAYAGFKLWSTIGPMLEAVAIKIGAVGIATQIAEGPIGWVTAAISALAAMLAVGAAATATATAATNSYTEALRQDNDAIGTNVRATAAKGLQDAGALTAATKLGISTRTLTDAVLGNADAQATVNAELKKVNDSLGAAGSASGNMTEKQNDQAEALMTVQQAYKDQSGQLQATVAGSRQLSVAVGDNTNMTKEQSAAQKALATTYGMTVEQLNAAEDAQSKNADQAAETTRQLQLENDAAALLTNAFTLLNGGTLNVAQAQTGAAAAANSLVDSLKNNTLEIDGNSKAAVANQQAIQQKVQADQQAAEAIAKQTGSTEAGTAAFAASKQALLDQLAAQGLLTPAIQAYIDKLYAVPPVVKTKAEMDADAATQKAAALKQYLQDMAKTWTAHVQVVTDGKVPTAGSLAGFSGGGGVKAPIYRAAGGAIEAAAYLAGGGNPPFVPHGTDTVPAMLTPGEFVVRESSASQFPGFLNAYNANPGAALSAIQQRGAAQTTVSLKGATLLMSVDGRQITAVIQDQIVAASRRTKIDFQAGMQEVAT